MELRRSPNVVNKRCYSKPNDFRVWHFSDLRDFRVKSVVRSSKTDIVESCKSGAFGQFAIHSVVFGP
jgi:hypothetical protein